VGLRLAKHFHFPLTPENLRQALAADPPVSRRGPSSLSGQPHPIVRQTSIDEVHGSAVPF